MVAPLLPLLEEVAAGACVAATNTVGGYEVNVAAGAQALTSKVKATNVVTIRFLDLIPSPLKK